jgi:hypothetical protein
VDGECPRCGNISLWVDGLGVYVQLLTNFLAMCDIIPALLLLVLRIYSLLCEVVQVNAFVVLLGPGLLWGCRGGLSFLYLLELVLEPLAVWLYS